MKQLDAIKESNLKRTYHLVFSTYYRYPTLKETKYRDVVTQWIREICDEQQIQLVVYKVLTDHVHLLLTKQPGQLLPQIMQTIKGRTTYDFFQAFPEMKKEVGKTRLWNKGYNETLIQSDQQLQNTIKYIENNFDKHQPGAPGFIPVGDKM